MTEETPFKSLKITLSDEALEKLAKIRATASLRSDSATIEECIRTFYDIVMDYYIVFDSAAVQTLSSNSNNIQAFTPQEVANVFQKIGLRVARFTPISESMKTLSQKNPRYRADNNLK